MKHMFWIVACALLLGALLGAAACSQSDQPAPATSGTTTGDGMNIQFRSETEPPRSGNNTVEVTVTKDAIPVADATVTAVFSMPAMPSMNMPAMHSTAALEPLGGGRYRGVGQLSMAGTWNVQITVVRDGNELGAQTLSIVAK